MKNLKYIVMGFLFFLAISVASAGWFGGITGNVASSTIFTDSDNCHDSDGGFMEGEPGIVMEGYLFGWKNSLKKDVCVGKGFAVILPNGDKVTGRPSLKEYYCNAEGNRDYETFNSEELGAGYCIYEDITGSDGKVVKNVARWMPAEPVCTVVNGGVKNERNKKFTTKCFKGDYIEYTCSPDGTTVLNNTIDCPNRCSVAKGGCIGTCADETDVENDKDVPGLLTLDGEVQLDTCVGDKSVKQFKCVDNALKFVARESCGTNRICDDGDGSGAFCKDVYATVDDVTDLSGQVAGATVSSSTITSLKDRVSLIEMELCSRDSSYDFCKRTICTDYNEDGVINLLDVDLLTDCLYLGNNCDARFDANGDGMYTIIGDVPLSVCSSD